jgi:hypothetical protein
MKSLLSLLLLAFPLLMQAQTHPEQAAVKAVIEQLFESMRKGDSSLTRQCFFPDARMLSTADGMDQEMAFNYESAETFILAVGLPHKKVWNEKALDWTFHIEDRIAQVWTPYAFYLNDGLSHCGINAFTLVKSDQGWKIAFIADTRRQNGCYDYIASFEQKDKTPLKAPKSKKKPKK